ncbi:hypothetical protein C8R45DRAFT_996102 [Mycena sanguinolenta]|nr:hypothetical protein C8R45DRAFT_996102 [Mycena sanguinolenta]
MSFQKARLVLDLVERAKDTNVFWITPRPSGQDVYNPGSTILAAWTSPQMVEYPAFQLCVVSTSSSEIGECSPTVWPEITETEGVFQAPVTVPDALWDGTFFLRMLDNSGDAMSSPTFFLHPVGDSAATVADSEPQAQAPLEPAIASTTPSPLSSSSVTTSSSTPPSLSSALSQVSSVPVAIVHAAKTPPVAYAVPLSAVAAIILVAGVFYLKQRRRGRPELLRNCKSSSSARSDVGYTLGALSHHFGHAASTPPKASKSRQRTLDAFPLPAYAQWGPQASPSTYHQAPPRPERPRLPPMATTGTRATHVVPSNYLPPSPALTSSTPTPRCLLPAPQQLHFRNDHRNPPDDNDKELYARVASKLSVYRPRR